MRRPKMNLDSVYPMRSSESLDAYSGAAAAGETDSFDSHKKPAIQLGADSPALSEVYARKAPKVSGVLVKSSLFLFIRHMNASASGTHLTV